MKGRPRLSKRGAAFAGLGLVVLVVLALLNCAGLMALQTGIYPGAHVIKNFGLVSSSECRGPECDWIISTASLLEINDSTRSVFAWYRVRQLDGGTGFFALRVHYDFGLLDTAQCDCPHTYKLSSLVSIVAPNLGFPYSDAH